ncbi:MAG TPA: efflux RND transporter periplasmic adaptor subunit [Candidatus Angelobacter sp.]|nr:efflux RND transporter periplasmic adaptor subunit [Candidatus Angelobacter sp.]
MQTDQHANESSLLDPHHAPPQVTPPPELPAAPPRKALLIIGVVLLVLVLSGAASMYSRIRAGRMLVAEANTDSVPTVEVVRPIAENPDMELVLPASLQAYEESPIFARTNGYLLRWNKDIGSRVNQGELLAEIDTPEIDQELMQARATRQQVAAQLDIAKISADRWQNLRKTDSVSQQEADMQASSYQQAVANLAAADANVRRLEQMESFKHVYAPFSGVLTKRTVDPGALINAGAGAAGKELFDIARVDPLRVFASVPQAYSPAIKVGMDVYITLQEIPGQKFKGTVARTADAIDPTTRTLLTEVDVPNKDGKLLPGSFGEVHFKPEINVAKITVPVNTMMFRQEGAQVAVVGPDNKVQLRPITIGRDYGATLEILGGVTVADRIVINPADSLENGQPVRVSENSGIQQP